MLIAAGSGFVLLGVNCIQRGYVAHLRFKVISGGTSVDALAVKGVLPQICFPISFLLFLFKTLTNNIFQRRILHRVNS